MKMTPEMRATWRTFNRRNNALFVMEEATAKMAVYHQVEARRFHDFESLQRLSLFSEDARRHSRLARRYLLALVGDGKGEDE